MPLLLARVDDRLIHGQVAFGWGQALRPTLFVIVSDRLRADPETAELCLIGVPERARGRVLSVAEALEGTFHRELELERTIVLFPGIEEPLRLLEGGFPLRELNLGGLHHAPGRDPSLPYVFLDERDRERLRALARHGVRVYAQDLPGNASHELASLLGGTR